MLENLYIHICIYTCIKREINSINFVNLDSREPQVDICCHQMMIIVPRMGNI